MKSTFNRRLFFFLQYFVEAASVFFVRQITCRKAPISWRTASKVEKNSSVFRRLLIPVCDVFTVLLTKLVSHFGAAFILMDLYYSWNPIDFIIYFTAISRILTVDKPIVSSTLQAEWKDCLGSQWFMSALMKQTLYCYCNRNFSSHGPALHSIRK